MKRVASIAIKTIIYHFLFANLVLPMFAQEAFHSQHSVEALQQAQKAPQKFTLQQDSTITLLSNWNYGRGGSVSSTGNYVFAANGGFLQIIDATADDPYNVIGEVEVGNPILSILADDSLLFS